MIAKYATACDVCPRGIQPGDDIVKLGGSGNLRWVHADCHPGSDAGAGATAAPTTPRAPKQARSDGSKRGRASQTLVTPPTPPGALEVYTDGACSGNPGPGGWAWAVADGRQASGWDSPTTNQRMEIRAALEAVRSLPGPLVVVSDSTYVVKCFRDGWWRRWHTQDWVNAAKKPVANRDLWEPLIQLVTQRGDVTFRWVKGHSGNPMNDLVDRLAVAAGRNQTPA